VGHALTSARMADERQETKHRDLTAAFKKLIQPVKKP
jgi:hypothetical protein